MFAPKSTGGDNIISYELWRDNRLNTNFAKVDSYAAAGGDSASLLVWSLTVSEDLLVEGRIYSFKFRSSNTVGFSQFTELLRVSLSD